MDARQDAYGEYGVHKEPVKKPSLKRSASTMVHDQAKEHSETKSLFNTVLKYAVRHPRAGVLPNRGVDRGALVAHVGEFGASDRVPRHTTIAATARRCAAASRSSALVEGGHLRKRSSV